MKLLSMISHFGRIQPKVCLEINTKGEENYKIPSFIPHHVVMDKPMHYTIIKENTNVDDALKLCGFRYYIWFILSIN